MDAKAKVVRWECRPLNWEVQYQQRDDGEWVKFTDHEAALAEQVAAYERMDAAYLAQWEATQDAKSKLTTLLTGLEALAKRMYADAEDKDRHYEWKCCCDLYGGLLMTLHASTLASAGLEGKGNG